MPNIAPVKRILLNAFVFPNDSIVCMPNKLLNPINNGSGDIIFNKIIELVYVLPIKKNIISCAKIKMSIDSNPVEIKMYLLNFQVKFKSLCLFLLT